MALPWIAICLGNACIGSFFEIIPEGFCAAALFYFIFLPSCFKFLQTFTQCSYSLQLWPLSSSSGASWALSGILEGTAALFAEGAKRAAHSLSKPIHLQDCLSWNIAKKVQIRRVIPPVIMTPLTCPAWCVCVCVCMYARFTASFVLTLLSCVSHFIPLYNGRGWQPHLKSRDERHHLQVSFCCASVCNLQKLPHTRSHIL